MRASVLLVLGLSACAEEPTTTYAQYNADDNSLVVTVGSSCDPSPCADAFAELTSSSGEVDIGDAWVSPGGGPIGTVHEVKVVLADEYESDVDQAHVRIDSGEARGVDEYELLPDSADEGLWTLEVTSVGEFGEEREDTFTFRLYEAVTSEDTGA